MVDAGGLNPPGPKGPCGFESRPGYHPLEAKPVLSLACRPCATWTILKPELRATGQAHNREYL